MAQMRSVNSLEDLKARFAGSSIEATKAALLKRAEKRASGAPTTPPSEAHLGIVGHLRSGGVWLLACVLGFCLLMMLMAREMSYEKALIASLAGNNFTGGSRVVERVAGVNNSHEASTQVTSNLDQVNSEKSNLEVMLRDVQQQLNNSKQQNAKQAEFVEMMEREKNGLLKNMTMLQGASKDKDAREKALTLMNKYKAKLDEKRLQRDAYLHKLEELGAVSYTHLRAHETGAYL
eukprot:3729553-Pyramimonas_sp.AAC.1